jgi:hypothetical protein
MLEHRVKDIMVKYTNGGPDHRTNFITVILADIAKWLVGDFDILVHFRTPAGLSIRNPAERLMLVHNLAPHGVACSRYKLSEETESILNALVTMSKIRDAKGDTVKKLIEETAQPVIDMLNLRFGRLTYDGKPMNVGEKATTDSIAAIMEQLKVFSDDYNFGQPDRGVVFKLPLFKEFAGKHLTLTDYGFQSASSKTCRASSTNRRARRRPSSRRSRSSQRRSATRRTSTTSSWTRRWRATRLASRTFRTSRCSLSASD